MKTRATAKFLPTSARKAGLVAGLVRGRSATEASSLLSVTNKKAAKILGDVLNSAIANAENNFGAKKAELTVESVLVGPGRTLKRFRPRAKGSAARIRHRTSHITIVLSDVASTESKVAEAETAKSEPIKPTKAKAKTETEK